MTTKEAIKKLDEEYPNGTSLYCADYNDQLSKDYQLKLIRMGYCDSIFDDWGDRDAISQIMDGLFLDEDLSDETNDACIEWIREKDTSTPMDDLLKNTRDPLCTYDLDFHFEDRYSLEDMEAQCKEFFDHLNMKYTEADIEAVMKVRSNASYGGTACLVFNADLSDFYGQAKKYIDFGHTVKFGIIDHRQGSGDYEEITLSFPMVFELDRNRINVDECTKYSIGDIFWVGNGIGGGYLMHDEKDNVVVLEKIVIGVGDT